MRAFVTELLRSRQVVAILSQLESWIAEIPPIEQPMRFGEQHTPTTPRVFVTRHAPRESQELLSPAKRTATSLGFHRASSSLGALALFLHVRSARSPHNGCPRTVQATRPTATGTSGSRSTPLSSWKICFPVRLRTNANPSPEERRTKVCPNGGVW